MLNGSGRLEVFTSSMTRHYYTMIVHVPIQRGDTTPPTGYGGGKGNAMKREIIPARRAGISVYTPCPTLFPDHCQKTVQHSTAQHRQYIPFHYINISRRGGDCSPEEQSYAAECSNRRDMWCGESRWRRKNKCARRGSY